MDVVGQKIDGTGYYRRMFMNYAQRRRQLLEGGGFTFRRVITAYIGDVL